MGSVPLFAVLLLVAIPATASASGFRPYIEAGAGWSSYSMGDLNNELGFINARIAPESIQGVHGGVQFDVGLGVELPAGAEFGLVYGRLNGSTSVSVPSGSLKYDVPANLVKATGRYTFKIGGQLKGSLGGALGAVVAAGKVSSSIPGAYVASGDLTGWGPLDEVGAGAEFAAVPHFSIVADAGYRHAIIGEVKVAGQVARTALGSNETLDYSGVFFRAGVKVALTK